MKPCDHQVGGHHHKDGTPGSLVDDKGRFYKPLQKGIRAERETAFYAEIENLRSAQSDGMCDPGTDELDVLVQLAKFVPLSFGVQPWHDDITLLVMEDVCAGYKQPCIIDIKVGKRTWYPWASQDLINKYREKDESSTQCTLGFRLCGLQVARPGPGGQQDVHKKDRHWGKTLTEADVGQALLEFADNGHLQPQELLAPLLQQLEQLEAVFQRQRRYQFYSCSVLVTYEGLAQAAGEVRLRVRLVDFAHVFTSSAASAEVLRHEAVAAAGPATDDNFLQGLRGLMGVVRSCLPQLVPA